MRVTSLHLHALPLVATCWLAVPLGAGAQDTSEPEEGAAGQADEDVQRDPTEAPEDAPGATSAPSGEELPATADLTMVDEEPSEPVAPERDEPVASEPAEPVASELGEPVVPAPARHTLSVWYMTDEALEQEATHLRRKRGFGIGMFTLGLVSVAAGAALIGVGSDHASEHGDEFMPGSSQLTFGAAFLLAGAVLIAAGTAMVTGSARRLRQLRRATSGTWTPTLAVQRNGGNAGAIYRF